MGGLKLLAVAALIAPMLSGCVVYDSTGGENVTVHVSNKDAPPAEAVRGARVENGALVVRVDSNGCTQASDFELSVSDGTPASVTLRRTKEDLCRALVRDGVEVSWTYADLGLESGATVQVLNPLK